MKKYIITFLLLFCALICTAQEYKSFDKAEWKHIKALCASCPDSIRNLVKTLLNGVTKSPLITAKSQLIYIGQSYISQGKEEKMVQEMLKALIKRQHRQSHNLRPTGARNQSYQPPRHCIYGQRST